MTIFTVLIMLLHSSRIRKVVRSIAGQMEAQNGHGAKPQTGLPAAGCEESTRQWSKQLCLL